MPTIARRTIGLISIAALAAFSCEAQDAAWREAKWGMNSAQVVEAFQGEAKKLEPPQSYKGGLAKAEIDPLKIVGGDFSARFVFDDSDKLLYVELLDKASYPEPEFNKLERGLIEKYGEPYQSVGEGHGSRSRAWKKGGTRVTLKYIELREIGKRHLTINYEPLEDSDTRNL